MSYGCIPVELIHVFRRLVSFLSRNTPLQRSHVLPHSLSPNQHTRASFLSQQISKWNYIRTYSLTMSLAPLVGIWDQFNREALDMSWLFHRSGSSVAGSTPNPEGGEPEKPSSKGSLPKTPLRPPLPPSTIQKLMDNPTLFDPIRKPRHPIVLCHGLYGFDVWGPSQFPKFQRHYWSEVLDILRGKIGAEVIVTGVPSTGSVQERATTMDTFLREKTRGKTINFIAHSMGGLDCRHLITHIRPTEYTPASLTTISTPHRGSPFMDWCLANIGIGALREAIATSQRPPYVPYSLKSPLLTRPPSPPPSTPKAAARLASEMDSASSSDPPPPSSGSPLMPLLDHLVSLPQSLTALVLSLVDSPAYSNLTTAYLRDYFNPRTPNVAGVKYYSVAGRTYDMSLFHPLWLPKVVLDKAEELEREEVERMKQSSSSEGRGTHGVTSFPHDLASRPDYDWGNDGLVTISSAKWGEFLGTIDNCDHWEIRGAAGFATAFKTGGEAGELGWTRGVDWSNWGIGWWGSSGSSDTSSRDPLKGVNASEKSHMEKAADRLEQNEKDAMSDAMSWVGEHMSKRPGSPQMLPGPQDIQKELHGDATQLGSKSKPLDETPPKPSKFDLERFYTALTRKLYDDGL